MLDKVQEQNLTLAYELDRETKGTYRFAPVGIAADLVGSAYIYLPKIYCRNVGIDPNKGFTMRLDPH